MNELREAGDMTRLRTLMSTWRAKLAVAGLLAIGVGLGIGLPRYHLHAVGTSVMNPAIAPGEQVAVDHTSAGKVPRRGDIVVARGGWGPAPITLTVRVIGVPGDHIVCDQAGTLTINGAAVREPYAHGDTATFGAFDITVPGNRYFVLGDARNVSLDSRSHLAEDAGTLPAAQIEGRVVAVVRPVLSTRLIGRTSIMAAVVGALLLAGLCLLVPAAWSALARLLAALRAGAQAVMGRLRRRVSEAD